MRKKSDKNKNRFIVLYHKPNGETVKMTKAAPYDVAYRGIARYKRIGIFPCEVVEVKKARDKNKK